MGRALILSLILSLIFGFAFCQTPQTEKDVKEAAIESCEAWLRLIDQGQYAEGWDGNAQYFKSFTTKEQWLQAIAAVRTPLGDVLSRELESAQYLNSLPGAPDGEYVVIQFVTSFENKELATETITPMLEEDGQWRIAGYYIR